MVYIVTREDVGGSPYPIKAFVNRGDAFDFIKGKSNDIVQFEVHEVSLITE